MRSVRPFAAALLVCLAVPFAGCGDEPAVDAPAPGGYATPESLVQALRAAVLSGDAATASRLYDPTDPAAATKAAFWGRLAAKAKRWGDVREAYLAKFGAVAWSSTGAALDAAWSQRDLGFDAALSEFFTEGRSRIAGDVATIVAGKFQLTLHRSDRAWRAFREATFGLTAEEVAALDGDVERVKAVLAAIAAATTPAEVEAKLAR